MAAPPPATTPDSLRRTVDGRYVAGVAGGIAAALDLDPLLVRVAFAVGIVLSPWGVVLYIAAWLVVPEAGDDRSLLRSLRRPGGLRNLGAALALGLGALAVLPALGPNGSGGLRLGVVLVAAGGLLLTRPTGRPGPGRPGRSASAPLGTTPADPAPGVREVQPEGPHEPRPRPFLTP